MRKASFLHHVLFHVGNLFLNDNFVCNLCLVAICLDDNFVCNLCLVANCLSMFLKPTNVTKHHFEMLHKALSYPGFILCVKHFTYLRACSYLA